MKNLLFILPLLAATSPVSAWAETVVTPTVKLTTEERYDDDVLLRTATGAGEMITKISPQVGLDLKQPTLTLESWYALDLLYMANSGRSDLDHRGRVTFKDRLSERDTFKGDAQVWRVTDPTSLPRLGLAVTPSPILYGIVRMSNAYRLTRRIELEPGYRFEGAQIYDGIQPPGFVHTPYLDAWYGLTYRASAGLEYRYQYFSFGPESDHANGVFGAYRYRLSRETTFTAKAGPVFWARNNHPGQTGMIPKATVELERTAGRWELGFEAGHDLVGASGFTAVLWADYASVVSSYHLAGPLRVFGAASYFRNGHADGITGWRLGPVDGASDGYALDAGVEWKLNRTFALQGSADRIAQLGGNVYGGADLVRDIIAARLVITAL